VKSSSKNKEPSGFFSKENYCPSSLFVLLDAAAWPEAAWRPYEFQAQWVSLFKGGPEEELHEVAPYLVSFAREDGLLNEGLVNWITREGLGKHCAMFLESQADLDTLYGHFREFIVAQDESGKAFFFRFYDPRVLPVYLPACTPEEVRAFFGPVSRFILEDKDPGSFAVWSHENGELTVTKHKGPAPSALVTAPAWGREDAGLEVNAVRGHIELHAAGKGIEAAGVSDTGRRRAANEDFICLDPQVFFALLADGMGGHEHGAMASKMALDIISDCLDPDLLLQDAGDPTVLNVAEPPEISGLRRVVHLAVSRANEAIYGKNTAMGLSRFMGTTLVGLMFPGGDNALWFHSGDSRLYRLRQGVLEILTRDHSARAAWENQGKIGPEPRRKAITRAIGPKENGYADIGWGKIRPGDIFLMCSDGLTDMVNDEGIRRILSRGGDLRVVAGELVEAANMAGGKDNISVIVCGCKGRDAAGG
jgi:protein phosphatase